MLALGDLQQLAARYRGDRDRRQAAPRVAEIRDSLVRTSRALAIAADTLADLDRHAAAIAGVDLAEVYRLHEMIESFAARFGAGAAGIALHAERLMHKLIPFNDPHRRICCVERGAVSG
jgi:hypothetical protein